MSHLSETCAVNELYAHMCVGEGGVFRVETHKEMRVDKDLDGQ